MRPPNDLSDAVARLVIPASKLTFREEPLLRRLRSRLDEVAFAAELQFRADTQKIR